MAEGGLLGLLVFATVPTLIGVFAFSIQLLQRQEVIQLM